MSNMLDYIIWRGDLPFSAAPLNEVDSLILAQLSMLRWENGLEDGQASKIKDLCAPMSQFPISVGFTPDNDIKLLELVTHCRRFGEIVLRDYTQIFDVDKVTQFAGVTLCLDDGTVYISFRGTDCSLIGWREDCDMAFCSPIPAQESALAYLETAAGHAGSRLYVGGHSKGGNLAMYASANISPEIRGRIISVFNHDGPGLSDIIDAGCMYERIADRLHTFVPQDSIVGMLLTHPSTYNVIKSHAIGFLQHDPYSWQVLGPAFEHLPALTRDSLHIESAFRKWLDKINKDDRRVLVDSLFEVLEASQSTTFGLEFWAGLFRNPVSVLSAIQDINSEKRRRITHMITDFCAAILKPDSIELPWKQ